MRQSVFEYIVKFTIEHVYICYVLDAKSWSDVANIYLRSIYVMLFKTYSLKYLLKVSFNERVILLSDQIILF